MLALVGKTTAYYIYITVVMIHATVHDILACIVNGFTATYEKHAVVLSMVYTYIGNDSKKIL